MFDRVLNTSAKFNDSHGDKTVNRKLARLSFEVPVADKIRQILGQL